MIAFYKATVIDSDNNEHRIKVTVSRELKRFRSEMFNQVQSYVRHVCQSHGIDIKRFQNERFIRINGGQKDALYNGTHMSIIFKGNESKHYTTTEGVNESVK